MGTLPGRYKLAIPAETDWVLPMRYLARNLPAPPFAPGAAYAAAEFVRPSLPTGFTYVVFGSGGVAGAAEPVWPMVAGEKVTSGSVAFMAVGAYSLLDTSNWYANLMVRTAVDGTAVLFCAGSNGRLVTGYAPPKFRTSHAYAVGERVVPAAQLNGWVYEAVVAGTSAPSGPVWGTTEGGTTVSGAVTFRNVGPDAGVSNLRLVLTAADTADVVPWGAGVYELQLADPFGNTTALLWDDAVLIPNLVS